MSQAAAASRETDCTEGAALQRSGRVKEPEEATESSLPAPSSATRNRPKGDRLTAGQQRSEADRQIEFFLRLHGLWEGIVCLPRPPPPPFDIDIDIDIDTTKPIEPPWQAIKEWIPDDEPNLNWFNQERDSTGADPECFDQSPAWRPKEIPLGDTATQRQRSKNLQSQTAEPARSEG